MGVAGGASGWGFREANAPGKQTGLGGAWGAGAQTVGSSPRPLGCCRDLRFQSDNRHSRLRIHNSAGRALLRPRLATVTRNASLYWLWHPSGAMLGSHLAPPRPLSPSRSPPPMLHPKPIQRMPTHIHPTYPQASSFQTISHPTPLPSPPHPAPSPPHPAPSQPCSDLYSTPQPRPFRPHPDPTQTPPRPHPDSTQTPPCLTLLPSLPGHGGLRLHRVHCGSEAHARRAG